MRNKRVRRRTVRVQGTVGTFGKAESIAVIGSALNYNADLLEEALAEIEILKQKIQTLEEVEMNENK